MHIDSAAYGVVFMVELWKRRIGYRQWRYVEVHINSAAYGVGFVVELWWARDWGGI